MTREGVKAVFGVRYRDEWTGISGVATARTEYAFDAPSVCLTWLGSDGTPKTTWVAEARLAHADSPPTGVYV